MSEPLDTSGELRRRSFADTLPPDLAAAYRSAAAHALFAGAVIADAKRAIQSRQPIGPLIADTLLARCAQHLADVRPIRDHVTRVLPELTAASESDTRFGSSVAHRAALDLADEVLDRMWRAVDYRGWLHLRHDYRAHFPAELIRARISDVCKAVAHEPWPDAVVVLSAVEHEAARVAEARTRSPSDPEPRAVPTVPPFDRLFPNYLGAGFAARVEVWIAHRDVPALPHDYHSGPVLPPRDRLLEWFDALNRYTMWERLAALLDFRGQYVGDFEGLVALEGWGRSFLEPHLKRPDNAFVVSILRLDQHPVLTIPTSAARYIPPGADREVPVLDHRKEGGGWMHPFEPADGWRTTEEIRQHVYQEEGAQHFCSLVNRDLAEEPGEEPPELAPAALVFRPATGWLAPAFVLDSLIESLWSTLRNVSITNSLATPIPPRPLSTLAPVDRLHAAFDSLGNWLRDTRRLHADFVEPIYRALRGETDGVGPQTPSATEPGGPPGTPPVGGDPFDDLRALAKKLRLKGDEAGTVLAVCDSGGAVRVVDLALQFEWANADESWNSVRKRLQKKLTKHGWRIFTHDKRACIERFTPGESRAN